MKNNYTLEKLTAMRRKSINIDIPKMVKMGYKKSPLRQILMLDLSSEEMIILLNFFSHKDNDWVTGISGISRRAFFKSKNRKRTKAIIEKLQAMGYLEVEDDEYIINLDNIQHDYKINKEKVDIRTKIELKNNKKYVTEDNHNDDEKNTPTMVTLDNHPVVTLDNHPVVTLDNHNNKENNRGQSEAPPKASAADDHLEPITEGTLVSEKDNGLDVRSPSAKSLSSDLSSQKGREKEQHIPREGLDDNTPKVEKDDNTQQGVDDNNLSAADNTQKEGTINNNPQSVENNTKIDDEKPKDDLSDRSQGNTPIINNTPKVDLINNNPRSLDDNTQQGVDDKSLSAADNTPKNDLEFLIKNNMIFRITYESNTQKGQNWHNIDISSYSNQDISKIVIKRIKGIEQNIPSELLNLFITMTKLSRKNDDSKLLNIFKKMATTAKVKTPLVSLGQL